MANWGESILGGALGGLGGGMGAYAQNQEDQRKFLMDQWYRQQEVKNAADRLALDREKMVAEQRLNYASPEEAQQMMALFHILGGPQQASAIVSGGDPTAAVSTGSPSAAATSAGAGVQGVPASGGGGGSLQAASAFPQMPGGLVPRSLLNTLITQGAAAQAAMRAEQFKVAQEAAARERQAGAFTDVANASARPAIPPALMGQLAEGEDPEAAAMIPRTPGAAALAPDPAFLLAARLSRGGLPAADIQKAMEFQRQAPGLAYLQQIISGQAAGASAPGVPPPRAIVDINEKGMPSAKMEFPPWAWTLADKALRDQGLTPDMPGYDSALFTAASQLVPYQEGGGVVGRGQLLPNLAAGVRGQQAGGAGGTPIGAGAAGASPLGAQPDVGRAAGAGTMGPSGQPITPLFQAPPKEASPTTTQDVAASLRVRMASNDLNAALKDPTIDNYIGPYGQYLSTAQAKAPFEMLGKVPPPVVDLEQNIATIRNYTIKLITGAQSSPQERERIIEELPDQKQQPDVFRQRLNNTMRTNIRMEDTVRTLALSGNQNAMLIAKELGLFDFQEKPAQGPAPAGAALTPPPKTQAPSAPRAAAPTTTFPKSRFIYDPNSDQLLPK